MNGRLPLFTLLNSGKGSLSQSISIMPGTRSVTGSPSWHKKPQTARAYGPGFDPILLQVVGGECLPPASGKTLLDLPAPATTLVYFLNGGISSVDQFIDLDQVFTMSAAHVISYQGSSPAQVKFTKIDLTKGTFTGTMSLQETNPFNAFLPKVTRPVTFQGVLVPSIGNGTGYFLLPRIAGPPADVIKSPMISGQVRIQSL